MGLALFLGCAGKSAQIPLYVWLPDAMAGPTPVSALIHAATMVTAGVYLLCRLSFVFVLCPAAMAVVAITGALTALFAATIALVQNDIKKVLAYSTVSQLGFMFLGVGVGAFTAGFFHVFTHAFFKACLFLGAGSVIHAMHARIHDTDASQDMRNMGGLRKYMPLTFWTFSRGLGAIIGLPFTSGFFSKDEILLKAYTSFVKTPIASMSDGGGGSIEMFVWPTWLGPVLYGIGILTAPMTAFYMSRLYLDVLRRVPGLEDRQELERAGARARPRRPRARPRASRAGRPARGRDPARVALANEGAAGGARLFGGFRGLAERAHSSTSRPCITGSSPCSRGPAPEWS